MEGKIKKSLHSSRKMYSHLSSQFILKSDFSNGNVYFMALGAAFITGFISAGGLALRDVLSENKESAIQKLPL